MILLLLFIIIIIVSIIVYYIFKDSFEDQNSENSDHLKNLPIFIINLKHRNDRKDNMINLMEKLNFKNYTFIVPLSKLESKKEMLEFKFDNISVEQYSLLKTVMNIHLDMLKRNINEYIIAEDDLELNSKDINYNYINKKYQSIKKNYNIFFLNFCYSNKKKISENLFKINSCLCAGFCIFNNSNNKLSNLLLNQYIKLKYPLDHIYKYIIKKYKLNAYGSIIFNQNTIKFGTDISGSQNFNKPW